MEGGASELPLAVIPARTRWQEPIPAHKSNPSVVIPPGALPGLGVPLAAARIPLLRLQMFVQGPRDRCDSSPDWNQRFAVSLCKSQLSLDGSDPRSSSPALCWFGWMFPAVQTQIPGPAGIPCSEAQREAGMHLALSSPELE